MIFVQVKIENVRDVFKTQCRVALCSFIIILLYSLVVRNASIC